MLPNKRITIKQVALESGVSVQTVSRVLNDRPDVATETRQRVKQVIEQLGYQPSALARSLIHQRSYTLGVITAGLRYIGPSRTLNGIAQKAEEIGYTLLLKELPSFDSLDVDPLLQSLLARQVDGIIWAVPEIGDNRAWLKDRLAEIPVPLIFITMEKHPDVSVITVDNYYGGQIATRYLLERGYKHIGHLAGPLDWWEARQRAQGWRDILAQHGYQVEERQCAAGNWSSSSGERAFRELLDQYPEMDAVFVGNDQMALGVLQVAARRGISIPRELGVVGFDNIPESGYFYPALTTISQDQLDLGCTAVEEVVHMIESLRDKKVPLKPKRIVFTPELLVRET